MSLAPALAGVAAGRRAGVQVAPDDGPDPAQGLQTTADVAIAPGQYWVRVDAHKIAALYLAFPKELNKGDVDADLPARADACAHVKRLGDHFAKMVEQEVKISGTRHHDQNEPLRLLIDIHDTLKALGTLLDG